MPVSGLDHVGVVVRNLDAALAAFQGRLGLSLVEQEELPEVGVRFAFLAAGEGTLLQLLEPTRPGPIQAFLDEQGEGLHHLCFAVPDIPAAMAEIAPGAGFGMNLAAGGRRAAFLAAAVTGTAIELIETEPYAARQAAGEGA